MDRPDGQPPAEVVLRGGTIYTADAAGSWAQAVAIRAGQIVGVGTDRAVEGLAGPDTEVIDLHDAMVLPGFIDSHLHAIKGGFERLRCNLLDADDIEEYRRIVHDHATSHAGDDWIVGGGWSMGAFPGGVPTARQLDDVSDARPVLLYSRDHHTAWVNSRAMELAGIHRDTPDPWGGRIDRDASGHPVGALQERAMLLVADLLPASTERDEDAALREGQHYLHSLGITGWQDAKVLFEPDDAATYLRAWEHGDLVSAVVGAQWWEPTLGLDQLERVLARRDAQSRPGLRFDAVKVMLDGVCENHTAAMLEPYLRTDAHEGATDGYRGGDGGDTGIRFYAQPGLDEVVRTLDRQGLQVHFHAIGDAAVRSALDAVESARTTNGDSGLRHHIAHVQVVDPTDLPRFRELRVVANAQPLWARNERQMTELTLPFLGEDRARHQYPFGSFLRAGVQMSFGSDWPVSTPDPLALLHVAVQRTPVPKGTNAGVDAFLPAERITLRDGIHAFTMGSAFVNGMERTHGSIEVGKQADLVTVDRNLFRDVSRISEASVLETRVAGRVVYRK